MKKLLGVALTALVACCSARAAVYTYNFNDINRDILDGDPGGITDTRVINDITGISTIGDVNVTLNISGGYNGDLYGYLVHDSGFVVLLNRIGRTSTSEFGSSGSGFSVTLDDQAATDIHLASYSPNAPLSGDWRPDGREIDPANALNTDPRTAMLDSFNGTDANGSWTLFLADMSAGDQATLVGWSLEISTVPEPIGWALIIFGAVVGTWKLLPRHLRKWRDWMLTCGR